jgi:hypothetical protein
MPEPVPRRTPACDDSLLAPLMVVPSSVQIPVCIPEAEWLHPWTPTSASTTLGSEGTGSQAMVIALYTRATLAIHRAPIQFAMAHPRYANTVALASVGTSG